MASWRNLDTLNVTRYETLSDVSAGVKMEEYGNGNGDC